MKLVRPDSQVSIDHLLSTRTEAAPTYPEIGATLRGENPDGYRRDFAETSLGKGRVVFQRSVAGLKAWKSHHVPGMRVFPRAAPIEVGATVVVTVGTPWLALAAPCRIVGVLDDPDQWGFAYGTLPGHPERGEESFVVSITGDGDVTFRIRAFSRPGAPLVRLAGLVARIVQRAGTRGYLDAMKRGLEVAD